MSCRVEIIKKCKGFKVGTKKEVTLGEAKHLEKKGIAKIIVPKSTDSLAEVVSNLESIVIEQGKDITELKKLIPKK